MIVTTTTLLVVMHDWRYSSVPLAASLLTSPVTPKSTYDYICTRDLSHLGACRAARAIEAHALAIEAHALAIEAYAVQP